MGNTHRIKKYSIAALAVLLLGANVFTAFRAVDKGGKKIAEDRPAPVVSVSDEVSSEEPVSSEEKPLTEEQIKAADELIHQMVTFYGCYGSKADRKVDDLLGELNGISTGQWELWQNIMDYWDYMNTDFRVNEKSIPEGLPEGDNLCIIVLGQKLAPDGKILYELNGRLQRALECAEKYPNAWVMCTGGGTASRNRQATEAGQMCSWLKENGVDSRRLIKEDKSKSTVENALNSYEILTRDYPQVDSILLVSSRYHLNWATLLFEAGFMKSSKEKNTPMIHVTSNYAFPINSSFYKSKYDLRWQAAGMFELIGDEYLMDVFSYDPAYEYYMRGSKPKL